jgi:hypothetical protein
MSSVIVAGDTSGSVTLQAPAVSGSTVLTLPTTTGTLVVNSGAQTIEFADGSASAPSITNSGDTNTGIFFPAADTIAFAEGGTESMRLDSSGNVGVGITPSALVSTGGGSGNIAIAGSLYTDDGINLCSNFQYLSGYKFYGTGYAAQNYFDKSTGGTYWRTSTASGTAGNTVTWSSPAMTLDASGNLGLGVTPRAWTSASGFRAIDFTYGSVYNATNTMGMTQNAYYNGTNFIYNQTSLASYYYQNGGTHNWYTAPSGTAGNAITFTAGMALDANRRLSVVSQGNGYNPIAVTAGTRFCAILASSNNGLSTASYGGASTADTAFLVGKDSVTSRSINAGGTINASGADYAEYMTKADDFVLAKGDVVGINSDGKLTNVYADAVSFVVKSTDPSYVGGDTWGSAEAINLIIPERPVRAEDDTDETFADKEAQYDAEKEIFDETIEAARQLVDRIAFAGQVPVNVLGATAGQYIIPVNDNGAIKGEAVTSPTFEQYQAAVGKVIAIEADGRARIIVKVA